MTSMFQLLPVCWGKSVFLENMARGMEFGWEYRMWEFISQLLSEQDLGAGRVWDMKVPRTERRWEGHSR